MAPVPEPSGSPDGGGGRLRKWFDDEDFEDFEGNSEWAILKENMKRIDIETIDSLKDPDLKDMVKDAREIDRDKQKKNVEQLKKYLEKKAKQEKEAEQRAKEEKKEFNKRHRHLSKTIRAAKALARPILKTFDFLIDLLDKTIFIASELTFQTHYEVALKAILLFRTAYQEAGGLIEEVVAAFERIDGYVEEMKFLSEEIKSRPLYKAVNRLFVSVVTFVAAAATYLGKRMIIKMVMALDGKNEKFRGLIKSIGDTYEEVSRVRTLVGLAINLESLQMVERIGSDTTTIQAELLGLNKKVSKLLQDPDSFTKAAKWQLQAVYDQTSFQSVLHVQNFLAKLFKVPYNPTEELSFNDRERVFLSPKDRWHRHSANVGSWTTYEYSAQTTSDSAAASDADPACPKTGSGSLNKAAQKPPRALIWIAGRISRRSVSWVSSFSVDLIYHLREFCNVDVVYAFCRRGQGARYEPSMIIKGFVFQLLELYPQAAIKNVRFLSEKRFEEVADCHAPGAARRGWELLKDVLRFIQPTMEMRNRRVLLLIDRLDLCTSNRDFSVLKDFIPALQKVSYQSAKVSVMITAAEVSPMDVHTLRKDPEWLLPYGQRVFR